MKSAKRKRAGRKRSKKSLRNDLVQIVVPNPGQSFDGDCACPLCAEMAAAGEPIMVLEPDGSERWVMPKKRPMMTVRVKGDATTWPELSPEGREVQVPVGCIVLDLLGYLCAKDQRLRLVEPGCLLIARIGKRPCEPMRVLEAGDEVLVSRVETPWQDLGVVA